MKKEFFDELRNWGCDIDKAMQRFMDDEALYESCLKVTANDENFEKLGLALKEGDVKDAFRRAHSLKGVLGNMGLTSMYELACEIVEPLRMDKTEGLLEKYNELIVKKNFLCDIIRRNDNENM